jgi:hypothetical protein
MLYCRLYSGSRYTQVRLTQWHVKALEAAQHRGIVRDFESSTHILTLENVPTPALLQV